MAETETSMLGFLVGMDWCLEFKPRTITGNCLRVLKCSLIPEHLLSGHHHHLKPWVSSTSVPLSYRSIAILVVTASTNGLLESTTPIRKYMWEGSSEFLNSPNLSQRRHLGLHQRFNHYTYMLDIVTRTYICCRSREYHHYLTFFRRNV